jgi:hypothetical protein
VLPGPEAAARAAAAAPAKRRADAEAALARAVADALHLLGGLQQLLPLMAGTQRQPLCHGRSACAKRGAREAMLFWKYCDGPAPPV